MHFSSSERNLILVIFWTLFPFLFIVVVIIMSFTHALDNRYEPRTVNPTVNGISNNNGLDRKIRVLNLLTGKEKSKSYIMVLSAWYNISKNDNNDKIYEAKMAINIFLFILENACFKLTIIILSTYPKYTIVLLNQTELAHVYLVALVALNAYLL